MSAVVGWVRRPWVREVVVVGLLYVAYSGARVVASDDRVLAMANARELLQLERIWGINSEQQWNTLLVANHWASVASAYWYATMHYVVTPLVLLLLWRRSRALYLSMRRVLVGSTVIALLGYLVFPTAPPRMLAGYVDVMAQTAHVGWWGTSASAPKGFGGYTNELAAMPSMHVGWALWCSIGLVLIARSLWQRVLSAAYVLVTVTVVVATANHWLIDAVVGAVIVGLVALAVHVVPRWRRSNQAAHAVQPVTPFTPVAAVAFADEAAAGAAPTAAR